MNFKIGILVLAAALLLCSAQLLHVTQVSASDNETGEGGVSLHGPPPPFPPFPPTPPPPPPTPPIPPIPPFPPTPPIPPFPPTPPAPPHHGWHFPGYNPYSGHWDYSWTNGRWPWYVSGRVIVVEPPYQQPVYAPVINSFTANPSYIQSGQGIVLTWTVTNADSVTLSPGIGSVPSSGSYNLTPGYTTTYILSATNSAGSVSAGTTVTVAPLVSTYITPSAPVASSGYGDTGTGSILTGGLSGDGSAGSNTLYITLIGLLAVAAAVAIVLFVRRPAAAHARAGYLATATRTASGAPATTPVDAGPGPKFILSNGEQLSLPGSSGSLGRSDFRSLVKPDQADLISRQHIRFDCEDGECFIEDRGSTNGTKLNGSSIDGKGRYLLREGDKVELADVLTLTFKS